MRSPGAVPWIALVALQFATLAAGQVSDAPSVENFVRRFSGSSSSLLIPSLTTPIFEPPADGGFPVVVVGNYAYLDGGEVIQMEGGTIATARTGICSTPPGQKKNGV